MSGGWDIVSGGRGSVRGGCGSMHGGWCSTGKGVVLTCCYIQDGPDRGKWLRSSAQECPTASSSPSGYRSG